MLRSEVSAQVVEPAPGFGGEITVPGDKSIAHRALILAALAEGDSSIRGLPEGEDVSATVACLRSIGVDIRRRGTEAIVRGFGLESFATPHGPLDCANSGTTMRLLLGL